MEKIICCPKCGSTDVANYDGMCVCFACRASFPAPKEPKPFQPMRLFISYGHPESEICQRIRDALAARGHDVWFDATNMIHGEDWRAQITDGITHSDGVISCLSKHSVRDPGVSLDELSIAIGVRGGNIKTILLESEKEVQPPASVCHIQWLDMSRWREMLSQGEEVFAPWFNEKMGQLYEVIEGEDSREFVGQINAIRDKLHVNYDTSKQKDLLRRPFVGREWLAAQVEAWLEDPAGARLCVMYGDPGVGKSAFAARYMHYNPRVAAGLFCEYSRPLYNDPRTVIMTLAYLLACRLPNYRMVLAEILEHEKRLGELNPSELFDQLLATPLSSLVIDGGQETLCIVIDGLDECAQGERNALAEVLGQYAERLPSWLRILATARDVAAVTGPLGDAFRMELRGGQEQNRNDVRQYFIEQLQEKYGSDPAWSTALETLTERSGGIFLYAALVANGIRAGKASIADSEQFPEGLSGAFHQWFGWFFPSDEEYKRAFRMPLGAILAAPEALPVQELKRIFGWDENEQNDFLRRIEVLLKRSVNDFGDETVSFSHQYLSEWLDTAEAGRFRSSRRAALDKMAERFYVLFKEDKKAVTYYEAVHMLPLLEESGRTDRRNELAADHDLFSRLFDAGDYCKERGKLDTALRCFEQSRGIAAEEVERAPASLLETSLLHLNWAYEKMVDVLEEKGWMDKAVVLSKARLAIFERLANELGVLRYRERLGQKYIDTALKLEKMGRIEESVALYEEGLKNYERLAREQGTPEKWNQLGWEYADVVHRLKRINRLDEALSLSEKNLAIHERLVREHSSSEYWKALSDIYSDTGRILDEMGRPEDAREMYEKAIAVCERLARELDSPKYWEALGDAYYNAAIRLNKQKQMDEAWSLYKKSLTAFERFAQKRDLPRDWVHLSVKYNDVASTLRIMGRRDEALALDEKSLAICERLAADQDTPQYWKRLSDACEDVGLRLFRMGRRDAALSLYKKSLENRERLVKERGMVNDRVDLAYSCLNLAKMIHIPEERRALAERGLEVTQALMDDTGDSGYQLLRRSFQRILDPSPVDTSGVELSGELLPLSEEVAEKLHSVWAADCLAKGWTYGDVEDLAKKTSPRLAPYSELPESEREFDRNLALEAVKLIVKLGYTIC